ncbi:hypothetical protein ACFFRR_006600 [Megaselia abdita]
MWKVICVAFLVCGLTEAIPKYETPKDNNQWRRSSATSSYYNTLEREKDNTNTTRAQELESAATKERIQRLGYTTGYGGISGYPNSGTGLSSYSPIKLDIGGIVVGTLVGLGAVIIIPKLISVLHGGYGSGGYGRSENGDDLSTLSSLVNRMDDVMAQNNIDSTSCMQRAVCSYVRSTENNLRLGSQDQIDQFVHSLSENSLVEYLLDGTAIKEALEHGKNTKAKTCDVIYPTCPLDSQTAMNLIAKMLPGKH